MDAGFLICPGDTVFQLMSSVYPASPFSLQFTHKKQLLSVVFCSLIIVLSNWFRLAVKEGNICSIS